ncbi:hypothetical protein FKV68_16535 [Sinorhizobium mexicanum]|uniref:Uncharacterized protein n=1 Tax=Sinorhizobium mexicanum TaxID=375549 RepID=A0A859QR12_9HYPH|nr:hypothetical protein FKV68_16535 [Sinorhizobium mexicanum]
MVKTARWPLDCSALLHVSQIVADLRTKTGSKSKCYSDLCASDKTGGWRRHAADAHAAGRAAGILMMRPRASCGEHAKVSR